MAHYKRRKPRTQIRCPLCTPHRVGNSAKKDWGGKAGRWAAEVEDAKEQIEEVKQNEPDDDVEAFLDYHQRRTDWPFKPDPDL